MLLAKSARSLRLSRPWSSGPWALIEREACQEKVKHPSPLASANRLLNGFAHSVCTNPPVCSVSLPLPAHPTTEETQHDHAADPRKSSSLRSRIVARAIRLAPFFRPKPSHLPAGPVAKCP